MFYSACIPQGVVDNSSGDYDHSQELRNWQWELSPNKKVEDDLKVNKIVKTINIHQYGQQKDVIGFYASWV